MRPLSRRSFLRGAGATIALPFLPSALPREARAAGPDRRPRVISIYAPAGMYMPAWTPEVAGEAYALSPTLTPFLPVRSQVSVLSGLTATATTDPLPGFHRRATASWLTCTRISRAVDVRGMTNGWSFDQLLGTRRDADLPLGSVQIGPPPGIVAFSPEKPYPATYLYAVSWRGNTPLVGASSPWQLWARLVGSTDSAPTDSAAARQRALGHSVLDGVLADLSDLQRTLGAEDTTRLDAYLTGLREVEAQLDRREDVEACELGDISADPAFVYFDQRRLMLDLLTKLLVCGVTRTATVILDSIGSPHTYTREFGHTLDHHTLSHHGGNLDWIRQVKQIDRHQCELVAGWALELSRTGDGAGGTLLDDSVVLFGSGMGDGDAHSPYDLPLITIGSAGGRLRTGTHLRLDGRPLADLHLTLLQAAGLEDGSFADSEAPIEALRT